MSTTLHGNAIVAQSGGPTTVINSSACGVIEETLRRRDVIAGLFGANNGILGIVQEDLFDMTAESAQTIADLRCTPSSAIGSCRYKLGDLAKDKGKYQRLLEVFQAHDIRYFFYIGGNDSMDTADKVDRLAKQDGYNLRVVGVPKTIDNDLVGTDHCPGYGSVAKFLATCVMEAGRDTEAMHTFDPVTVTEAMGRNTGWIAASAGLASRHPDKAPISFTCPRFPSAKSVFWKTCVRCIAGSIASMSSSAKASRTKRASTWRPRPRWTRSAIASWAAARIICGSSSAGKLGSRRGIINWIRFNATPCTSLQARTATRPIVRAGGSSPRPGRRQRQNGGPRARSDAPYRCGIKLVPLAEVANGVKPLPRDYMNVAGNHISQAMRLLCRAADPGRSAESASAAMVCRRSHVSRGGPCRASCLHLFDSPSRKRKRRPVTRLRLTIQAGSVGDGPRQTVAYASGSEFGLPMATLTFLLPPNLPSDAQRELERASVGGRRSDASGHALDLRG